MFHIPFFCLLRIRFCSLSEVFMCTFITAFECILCVFIGTLHDRDAVSLQQKILTFVRLSIVLISFVLMFFVCIMPSVL